MVRTVGSGWCKSGCGAREDDNTDGVRIRVRVRFGFIVTSRSKRLSDSNFCYFDCLCLLSLRFVLTLNLQESIAHA
jgi:hypothetical protein